MRHCRTYVLVLTTSNLRTRGRHSQFNFQLKTQSKVRDGSPHKRQTPTTNPIMCSVDSTGSNGSNGNANGSTMIGTTRVKQGLAQMLKGGVIVRCSTRSDTS
jgi:hypothetical protein